MIVPVNQIINPYLPTFLGYAANCRVKRENEEKKLERENENVCVINQGPI